MRRRQAFAGILVLASLWQVRAALACGCFAPPDVATPIVQAGERILFARDNGIITAHIQIQYAGPARDFGWLLPLPSLPTLELGSDEVFAQLQRTTQPTYRLIPQYEDCNQGGGGGGGGIGCMSSGGDSGSSAGGSADAGTGGPLVVQSSIGPYDYAVLKGDSDVEMLEWLAKNHYFVPAGTADAVKPYIHPGAYFLALRLSSGKSSGDVQPVVVKYASDLPMIPIVLTSVGAQPDMGIQVWMLGRARAIPRNYAHTVINDALLDWPNGVRNYNDVVIRATKEAAGRHTFITEYAGPSAVMRNVLAPDSRFGGQAQLAAQPTMEAFGKYLREHGYAQAQAGIGMQATLSPTVIAILTAYAPMPASITGVTPSYFYLNLEAFHQLGGWPESYDPAAMAAEIFDRYVEPMRAAEDLFHKYPMLTRLYTTLSPGDMTRDPVFTENASLPAVSNQHQGTITYHCGGALQGPTTPATIETDQGFIVPFRNGTASPPSLVNIPASQRIESILEEGPAALIKDNSKGISDELARLEPADSGDGGCRVAPRGRYVGLAIMALLVLWRVRARPKADS